MEVWFAPLRSSINKKQNFIGLSVAVYYFGTGVGVGSP